MNIALISRSTVLMLAVALSSTGCADKAEIADTTKEKTVDTAQAVPEATKAASSLIQGEVQKGLNDAARAKLFVSEMYFTNSVWPSDSEYAANGEMPNSNVKTAIGNNGVITVTYTSPVELAGKYITLTPIPADTGMNWNCANVDLPVEYLPANCQ